MSHLSLFVSCFRRLSLLIMAFSMVSAGYTKDHPLTVKRIQDYLNGIQSLKAEVIQLNPDHQRLTGYVYLLRKTSTPYGQLRIEYHQGQQDLVIADGKELILFNPSTKEKTLYSIDETPAAFLLEKKIDLERDFTIKSLKDYPTHTELVMTKFGAGEASITLKFSTSPMLKLNGWSIVDTQGNRTDVQLKDVVINIDLASSLFKLPQ